VKFGKIDIKTEGEKLEKVSWDLPQVRVEWATQVKDANSKTSIRTGGTSWRIKSWRGSVYPLKDPMRTWGRHYGKHFESIEFNATHYRIYSPEKMKEWASEMPDDFIFCPKFPAIISHYRRFNNCEGPTDDFIDGIVALGDRLGPAFLQLPPHYAPKHSEKLVAYLKNWPREIKMAVEFRHADWFKGGEEAEKVWSLLTELGIGAVVSDTVGRPDAIHMRLTAPFLLVRFGGYDGHKSDEKRLRVWAEVIRKLRGEGTPLESFDLLVHTTDSEFTPETCSIFKELINQVC
jgi:uncharacterized protein YecE (DUF72 family)